MYSKKGGYTCVDIHDTGVKQKKTLLAGAITTEDHTEADEELPSSGERRKVRKINLFSE